MGKKQHSKDRLYITKTEWATEWGGAKGEARGPTVERLPYYCCALSFTPFEDPVCSPEGHVFDILNIVPYIQKFGKNPVTGNPLTIKELVKLQFHKNDDGEYHCPVMQKAFTEFSHIVAIRTTGNVFSYEAVRELCIKAKNWRELLTDEPFKKEDLITLQDPQARAAQQPEAFHHVRAGESAKADDAPGVANADIRRIVEEVAAHGSGALGSGGGGAKAKDERDRALAAIEEDRRREARGEGPAPGRPKPEALGPEAISVVDAASAAISGRSASAAKGSAEEVTRARVALHTAGERVPVHAKLVQSRYTSGAMSRSFTSTSYSDPVTRNDFAMTLEEKNPTKKGYLRLQTTHGDLNVELHCDLAPRAGENFITHAERGFYTGVPFHRCIRNFMIQGGDPTGTGRGGESIWGKPFKDELNSLLKHNGRGVLSMANSGPHSNGSQFFILFKSAPHLDGKHTVFGRVVGGMETLAAMERVPVDDDDRPKVGMSITGVTVFVNPYTEPEEEPAPPDAKGAGKGRVVQDDEDEERGQWFSNPIGNTSALGAQGTGIGKYLKPTTKKPPLPSAPIVGEPAQKRVKATGGVSFNNFSSW